MPRPRTSRRNRDDRLGLRLSPHDAGFPAAHIGFVHLDRAAQEITPRPHHGAPQLVQPSPGGLITAQAKNALQAERTDPVLLVGHVPHRLEPKAQWLSSALEDRPRRHRCLTLTPVASQLTPRRRPGVGSAARRASKTFRPTNTPKKLRTRRLRHEPRVEFSQGAAGSRPRLRDGMPGSPSQHIDITRAKWIPYFWKISVVRWFLTCSSTVGIAYAPPPPDQGGGLST